MNQLRDLLHDAADGPVGFDHRDIGRRVRRRRRNTLAAVAAAVALVVVGIVAGAGDDEQVVDSVGPVEDAAVTVDELVADRWVAMAYSAVVVADGPPAFLEITDDGRLAGFDGCHVVDGTWHLDGDRLVTDLEPTQDVPCANEAGGLLDLLDADPTVGRFDGGMLELRDGELFVAFERFDRLGELPTSEALAGTWAGGTGEAGDGTGQVTFEPGGPAASRGPDGTAVVELLDCSQAFRWSLDGDALVVDGLDRRGVPCGDGVVGGALLYTLTGSPRLRVSGSALWVSFDMGVGMLPAVGAAPDATTTIPEDERIAAVELDDAALVVPFVTASPEGVTRHDGPEPTRIVGGAAAVAFAVGPDIVVHQAATTELPQYPPSPHGAPVLWASGQRRELPVAADAVRTQLLDATVLDGTPVALIAESSGGVGPDDTFEELVLVDLETLERRTVVRRPAWESGHLDGRVLADGDVLGLIGAESVVVVARWRPGAEEPVWTSEIDAGSRPTLTVVDDEVRVITAGFDDDLQPLLRIRRYPLDGTGQGEDTLAIADPAGALATGLHCSDWFQAHLLCGRSDGPPILVSVTTGAFAPLAAPVGSHPTLVR